MKRLKKDREGWKRSEKVEESCKRMKKVGEGRGRFWGRLENVEKDQVRERGFGSKVGGV